MKRKNEKNVIIKINNTYYLKIKLKSKTKKKT